MSLVEAHDSLSVVTEVAKITGEKGLLVSEKEETPDAAQNKGTDVANMVREETRLAVHDGAVHTLSFSELLDLESFVIDGFTEVGKDELQGVPHVVTGVTFWTPKRNPDKTLQRGFVSVECTIGDANALDIALRRGWIPNKTSQDQLLFSPNERVVYNDGSTGVRRQLVQILHDAKLIDVGTRDVTDASRFDVPWLEWESFTQFTTQGKDSDGQDIIVPSIKTKPNGNPLIIVVPRGLVKSEYSNSYTDDGVTYFLR